MRASRSIFLIAFASLGGCSLIVSTSDLTGGAGGSDSGFDSTANDAPFSSNDSGTTKDSAITDTGVDASLDPYAIEVLADKPVVYYRLDETSSGIIAHDLGSFALNATYGANVTRGQPSLIGIGNSAGFPGDSLPGVGSVIRQPADDRMHFANAFSVECWIERLSGGSARLVSYGSDTGPLYEPWVFQVTAEDHPNLYLANVVDYVSTLTISGPGPHHLVATFDGATIEIYLDGVPDAGIVIAANSIQNYDEVNGLGIGGGYTGTPDLFHGTMDEVAIYKSALSSARVLAHYAAGTSTAGD